MQLLKPLLPAPELEENQIEVQGEIQLQEKKLILKFQWLDPNRKIKMGHSMALTRKTELWKTTCFEAFFQIEGKSPYYEINVSADGHWNAYRFSSYRHPQPPPETDEISALSFHRNSDSIEIHLALHGDLMSQPTGSSWRCGITAVIEMESERKYYFAIDHLGDRPDFHLAESFKLRRGVL